MNVTSSTALSGMYAAQSKLNASAHNIANLGTQGFTRQEVLQSSAAGGGTQVSLRSSPAGVGNNLEADLIQQLQSALTYQANVSVLKTNNQVMGTLINIKA
jgi:flagellar hook-associated protein FlgK